jgi:hypothetical protein
VKLRDDVAVTASDITDVSLVRREPSILRSTIT